MKYTKRRLNDFNVRGYDGDRRKKPTNAKGCAFLSWKGSRAERGRVSRMTRSRAAKAATLSPAEAMKPRRRR